MGKYIDLIGKKFGRLTVFGVTRKNKKVHWVCDCDCGGWALVATSNLKNGNSKSCSCISRENSSRRLKTHGMRNTRAYKSWCEMKHRCDNSNFKDFNRYGGRGINYCSRWNSFENFYEDMGDRPEGTSIDRIDTNGNYEPSNCRWATQKTQQRNRRNNRLLKYNGKLITMAEISETTGIQPSTIRSRINRHGWSVERATTTPAMKYENN